VATALRGRGLGRAHAAGALVLGAGAVLDAVIAAVAVAAGERPAEPVPFGAYLLLSLVAVPVGWRYARATSRGWDAGVLAVVGGALCVVCVRLVRTWE